MRKFILGVGAQKSGTTWLYEQLAKQNDFKAPAVKEMHVLDAIFLGKELRFRKEIERRLINAIKKNPNNYMQRFVVKKFHMLLDNQEYFRYYDGVLDENDCFSCDITPSYSGLPDAAFSLVKSNFDKLQIETRVVFLLREPVSRLESMVKMRLRLKNKLEEVSEDQLIQLMRRESGSHQDRIRSSYRKTVDRIRANFREDQVFIGFYETLFTGPELDRLSNVLGVDASKFDTKKRFNHTKEKFRYPREVISELRSNYEDEYRFAVDELGLEKAVWDRSLENLVRT